MPTGVDLQKSNSTGPRKWNGGHVPICCHRSKSDRREYFSPLRFCLFSAVSFVLYTPCLTSSFWSRSIPAAWKGTEDHRRILPGISRFCLFPCPFFFLRYERFLGSGSMCGERRKNEQKTESASRKSRQVMEIDDSIHAEVLN